MASDSTSIDDLPGGNNTEQQNRVVLEKTEIAAEQPVWKLALEELIRKVVDIKTGLVILDPLIGCIHRRLQIRT